VQQVLGESLQTLLHHPVNTTGAGRTDTGVHAQRFTAHFESEYPGLQDPSHIVYQINQILPDAIAVKDIYRVRPDAHARFSALSRTYEYRISRTKDPFDALFAWYFVRPLDVDAMRKAADMLPSFKDYSSFSKVHTQVKTNFCKVYKAEWCTEGDKLIFRISADRFLRNMVRALVGTLMQIGLGRISPEELYAIFEGKDRRLAGFSAPACGLSLTDINYPADIRM
jgi:tRNA pseudouridine38-40 synthase